jgi:hypothetical protein
MLMKVIHEFSSSGMSSWQEFRCSLGTENVPRDLAIKTRRRAPYDRRD